MTQDIERLKDEYARRHHSTHLSARYAPTNVVYLFTIQQRQRATIELLKTQGLSDLTDTTILEIGSGGGDVLYDMMWHRIKQHNLFGIDLIRDRLTVGNQRFPSVNLAQCDAQYLPYPVRSFDLTLAYTVFSSILDATVRTRIANEMLRVTQKYILWYDFWLNPSNPQTHGMKKADIRGLFPNCEIIFKRTTLAPPLARRIVPISWTLAAMIEKLRILNTHHLALVTIPSNAR